MRIVKRSAAARWVAVCHQTAAVPPCDVGHPLPQGLEGSQAEVCLVHLPSLERNGPPNMASDKSIELEPGVSQGVVTYVRQAALVAGLLHVCVTRLVATALT